MKNSLRSFRHMEMTYCQKPKQHNQMKQIGFKKASPLKSELAWLLFLSSYAFELSTVLLDV